jgi:DNA-binding NtrC family response regulator
MTSQNGDRKPIILLVDPEGRNSDSFQQWLDENELLIREASDIYEVLEEITDFTMRQCPDVVLLEVNSASVNIVREMFQVSSGASEIEILVFSSTATVRQPAAFTQAANVSQLKKRFNQMESSGFSRAA